MIGLNPKRRSMMKYKCVILIGVLLQCISCAHIEPARVENGIYINPEYHFSIHVPNGWMWSEKIPDIISKGMSIVSREKFKATFYDLDSKSFILVAAEKTEADMLSLKLFSNKFITALDNNFAKNKKKFLNKSGWHDYRYEIYKDKIENCDSVCVATKIDFHFQDNKATGHNIMFESKYGKIYSSTLILVAGEEEFMNSLDEFSAVVNSFQRR
jgi:hypothetical protein